MSDTAVADNEKDLSNEGIETEENAGNEGPDDGTEGSDAEGLGEDGREDEEEVGGESGAGKQPSRSQRRIERLAEESRRERDRAERLERELSEERSRRQRDFESDEQLRLAAMTEGERFEYLRRKDREEMDRRFAGLQFEQADSRDKSAFQSLCAKLPQYAKLEPEVEKLLAEARRQGNNPSREILADILFARKARERASKELPRQRAAAAQERQRQQGKPSGSRGDVSGGRSGKEETAEARRQRLEGYRF